jgi:hypothetical protein
VTDSAQQTTAEWKGALESAASAAGHEMRNALNGLVVNLEVVRSLAESAGFSAEPFMTQAVSQSEESVRLAEATIALLKLVTGAIRSDGTIACQSGGARQVSVEAGTGAERVVEALKPLLDRGVLSAETSGSTVILRIPEDKPQ